MYRMACLLLSALCLLLLLVVIFLATKGEYRRPWEAEKCLPRCSREALLSSNPPTLLSLPVQAESPICSKTDSTLLPSTCSPTTCQALYNIPTKRECRGDEDSKQSVSKSR